MKKYLFVLIFALLFLLPQIALAGPFLYITNHDSNNVSVIDTATNAVTATIPVGNHPTGIAVGNHPTGIAVDYLGGRAYAANTLDGTVSVIDTATSTVAATIPFGINPIGLALNSNGTRLYVTDYILNIVFVIDTTTNTVSNIIPAGAGPQGIAVSPDGKNIYVANTGDNTVSVIDPAHKTVTAIITVGNKPIGVDVTPDSSLVIVVNQNTVSLISAATNTVAATVPAGNSPEGVAIVPDGTRAYITNFSGNNVSVINTATNTVVATIPVGTNPLGVAVDSSGKRAYVANQGGNTVSVIDTTTNTVVATVPVGNSPRAFGRSIGPSMMPVPVAASFSRYDAVVKSVLSPYPSNAKPFAVGELSSGNLNFSTAFVSFAGNVDIFLAFRFSGDPTKIKNLNPDHTFTTLSLSEVAHALSSGLPPAGVVPWKHNTTGPVSEVLFSSLPLLGLPPGTYTIYVLVTPSGTLASHYLWTTEFAVPVPIGGNIVTDNFLIAAGETRLATTDLTVRASKSIQIDGTLLVNEGVNVALLSDGPLTINGKIKPNVTASSKVAAAKADGQRIAQQATTTNSIVFLGSDVTFTGDVIYSSPGVDYIVSLSNGTVTINGNVTTEDGKDGTQDHRDGGDSASIEIGTDAAIQAMERICPDCTPGGRPAKVIITGILKTGYGGNGFTDRYGTLQGATQAYLGGKGGNSGNISISSDTIDLTAAALTGGDGGNGGGSGEFFHHGPEFNGKNNGDSGRDIVSTSGNGGNSGSVIFTSPNITAETGRSGRGGGAGWVEASAGSGGPGGRGGNTSVVVGVIGQSGSAPNQSKLKPWFASVALCYGGNGGNSADSNTNGGRGGNVTVSGPGGLLPVMHSFFIGDYSNGGNGFNGCNTPITNGSSGGDGGSVMIPGYTQDVYKIRGPVINGGNGGSGDSSHGSGGAPGNINSTFFGTRGTDGKPCPVATIQPGTYTVTIDPNNDGCALGSQPPATMTVTDTVTETTIEISQVGANSNVMFKRNPDGTWTSVSSNLVLLGSGGDSITLTFTIGPDGKTWKVTLRGSNANGGSCVTGGNANK